MIKINTKLSHANRSRELKTIEEIGREEEPLKKNDFEIRIISLLKATHHKTSRPHPNS